METKSLLFGLIGFFLGGLLVSVAATTFDKPLTSTSMEQMTEDLRGKQGEEFDKAFITSMIHHHQAAIDMASLAKEKAGHKEITDLALTIASTQGEEIKQLQQWQKDWGYQSTSHSSH